MVLAPHQRAIWRLRKQKLGPAAFCNAVRLSSGPGTGIFKASDIGKSSWLVRGHGFRNPALGVDPSGLDLTFVQALLVRGPDRNPFFQGAGAQLLGSLPGYEIFATLIPEHGTIFNLGYNGHEISGLDLQIGHVLYLDRQAALVPESSTLALFVAGIGVLLGIFRSKRLFPCRSIRINGLRHH